MSERKTRPCRACGSARTCRFSVDAWVCSRCGAEWWADGGGVYAAPGEGGKR